MLASITLQVSSEDVEYCDIVTEELRSQEQPRGHEARRKCSRLRLHYALIKINAKNISQH